MLLQATQIMNITYIVLRPLQMETGSVYQVPQALTAHVLLQSPLFLNRGLNKVKYNFSLD